MKAISIIIPTYNRNDLLNICVDSIRRHTKNYNVVIIDNGSNPPYDCSHLCDVDLTVLYNNENLGFPKAINQGIKASSGEIVIILNNDCVVTPYWSDRMVKGLEKFDIVGALSNYSAGIQQVFIPVYNSVEELDESAIKWASAFDGKVLETDYVIGFCMAFKRSVYDTVGEFDESLWPSSGEEIDFCLRAREKGFRVGVCCDVYVHHFGSQTFKMMEKLGIVNYKEVCKKVSEHLNRKWRI